MKIKITTLAFVLAITAGCKKDREEALKPHDEPLEKISVTSDLSDRVITEKITCNNRTFTFEFPVFKGSDAAVHRLEQAVFKLMRDDLKEKHLEVGYPSEQVYEHFMKERRAQLCKDPKKGLQEISVAHLSENEDFISYEIVYKKNNAYSTVLSSFRKNGLTPIYLQELIKPERAQDVQTIFDINIQAEAVSLALLVKPEDRDFFQSFIKDKVYQFEPGSFENLNAAFRKGDDGMIFLQVAKQIALPQRLSYLNNVIVLEILTTELNAYLDFSKVK